MELLREVLIQVDCDNLDGWNLGERQGAWQADSLEALDLGSAGSYINGYSVEGPPIEAAVNLRPEHVAQDPLHAHLAKARESEFEKIALRIREDCFDKEAPDLLFTPSVVVQLATR